MLKLSRLQPDPETLGDVVELLQELEVLQLTVSDRLFEERTQAF